MRRRRYALPLLGCVAVLALASAQARAAGGAPVAAGYIGKGQLVVQTAIGGPDNKLTVGGDIALEELGSRLRVDVLSLGVPGTAPIVSSLLSTQFFPPGGFTIVLDRTASDYTVWSNAKRAYYTSRTGSTGSAPPPGGAAAALGAAGDLFGAFAPARSLKDASAFSASLSLAGHGTVNGHPATGLDFSYAKTTAADALNVHGRLQLADDLDAVPVQIAANVKSRSIPESSLRLDLTTLAKATPSDTDFTVPPGFARAASLGDVIGKTLQP